MKTPVQKLRAAETLSRAGWSTEDIADLFGVTQRAAQKWLRKNQVASERVRRSCRSFIEQARILGE